MNSEILDVPPPPAASLSETTYDNSPKASHALSNLFPMIKDLQGNFAEEVRLFLAYFFSIQ